MNLLKLFPVIYLSIFLMLTPSGDLIAKQHQNSKNKTYHNSSHASLSSKKKHSSSQKKHASSNKKPSAGKQTHAAHKKSNPQKKRHSPYVSRNNYENYWYQSTFPNNQASIEYHTQKHGNGRESLQYTRDAVNFYEKNKRLRKPVTLKDGSPGYEIKKGAEGGKWTKNGQIVTFWD